MTKKNRSPKPQDRVGRDVQTPFHAKKMTVPSCLPLFPLGGFTMLTNKRWIMISAALVCALLCFRTDAKQGPITIPTSGTALLGKDVVHRLRVGAHADQADRSVVSVPDQSFADALQVTVLKVPKRPWDVQAMAQFKGTVHKGDVLLVSCWLRCLESTAENGEGQLVINIQRNRAPHDKLLALRVSAGGQWGQVIQAFRAPFDLPDGNGSITFHLGVRQQKLLIGGIQLINFRTSKTLQELPTTVETYRGRSRDADWRNDAAKRIKQYRQAPLTVVVKDSKGQPIRGVSVTVTMLRHHFTFGSAVAAKLLAADTDDARQYREVIKENYNKVVFENDLKWDQWNFSKTNDHRAYRREWTDRSFRWLQANNIAVRGHYITWAPLKPRQVAKYQGDGDRLRRDLWNHMQDKVPDVGGKVTDWDVINHIVGWGKTIESIVGTREIYADIIKRSRELAPADVQLWINEGQVLPNGRQIKPYEEMMQYLIDHEAAPDGIGFMGHFGAHSLTPPDRLFEVFNRFAKLSDNLQLTELDVDVGRDEQLQADYLRDVMTIAFSHPNMRSIIMWGFWEGQHWKPHAALYRRDWSIKPAGQMWRDLVFGHWRTETAGKTGAAGTFATDGFLGDYQIKVTLGNKSKVVRTTLAKPSQSLTVVLE